MAILKIKDGDGNIYEILALKGEKGDTGPAAAADEDYDSQSTNAQSGTAVAQAIAEAKAYTDSEIAQFDLVKIVDTLPEEGLPNRMYLVPKGDAEGNDLFDEYIWADGAWEFITTKQIEVDLSGYIRSEDVSDYIVEQGTSGIWTYRKWNSGMFDAHCYYQEENMGATTSTGVIYRTDEIQISPPTFTKTIDCLRSNCTLKSEFSWSACWDTDLTIGVAIFCARSMSDIARIILDIKGTWK